MQADLRRTRGTLGGITRGALAAQPIAALTAGPCFAEEPTGQFPAIDLRDIRKTTAEDQHDRGENRGITPGTRVGS